MYRVLGKVHAVLRGEIHNEYYDEYIIITTSKSFLGFVILSNYE